MEHDLDVWRCPAGTGLCPGTSATVVRGTCGHCGLPSPSPSPASDERGLRPEVLAFARAMEAKLRKHDHDRGSRGWANDDPLSLQRRLHEEAEELDRALLPAYPRARQRVPAEVLSEACDVANFAMMVADACGALASPRPQGDSDGGGR